MTGSTALIVSLLLAAAAHAGAGADPCEDPLCGVGAAAAQSQGSVERGRRLEALRDEMSRLMEESIPWMQRYEALIRTYFEREDIRTVDGERQRLRGELDSRYRRMTEIHTEFKKELNLYEARVMFEAADGLGKPDQGRRRGGDRLKGRKAVPGDSAAKLIQSNSLRNFSDQVQILRERIVRDMGDDDRNHGALLEAQEKRARWLRLAGGLTASVLLFAAVGYFLRRRGAARS